MDQRTIFATVLVMTLASATAAIILALKRPNTLRRRLVEALISIAVTGALAVSSLLGH